MTLKFVEVTKAVRKAGVVGAGGGGFPTHVKLSASARILIINAAECEPGLSKDLSLLGERPDDILTPALKIAGGLGAGEIILALKEKHRKLTRALEKLLSSDERYRSIKLLSLPDIYPIGDEFLLVELATGKRIPQGGLPLEVGCVVQNVETLYNIGRALQGKPVVSKYITVLGEVGSPGVYQVPVGISFGEIVSALGGATIDHPRLVADGLMMGRLVESVDVVEKTTSALFVLPRSNRSAVRMTFDREQVRRQGRSACEQCRLCTDLCPRYLLGYDIQPHRVMQGWCYSLLETPLLTMVFNCSQCGVCEQYACPMDLSPRRVCVILQEELTAQGVSAEGSQPPTDSQSVFRSDRLLPNERLITKLGLRDYCLDDGKIKALTADQVSIPLEGPYGGEAKPKVKVGDEVSVGQVLAEPTDDRMGLAVHSSISGKVWKIDRKIHISSS